MVQSPLGMLSFACASPVPGLQVSSRRPGTPSAITPGIMSKNADTARQPQQLSNLENDMERPMAPEAAETLERNAQCQNQQLQEEVQAAHDQVSAAEGLPHSRTDEPAANGREPETAAAVAAADTGSPLAAASNDKDSRRPVAAGSIGRTTPPVAADGKIQQLAVEGRPSSRDGHSQEDQRSRSSSPSRCSALALASPRITGVNLSSTSCPASRNFWGCLQHELQCESCGHK